VRCWFSWGKFHCVQNICAENIGEKWAILTQNKRYYLGRKNDHDFVFSIFA
jgi:hypothetical protein